jgi:hypothetical protein
MNNIVEIDQGRIWCESFLKIEYTTYRVLIDVSTTRINELIDREIAFRDGTSQGALFIHEYARSHTELSFTYSCRRKRT